jgi:hypothetical protein
MSSERHEPGLNVFPENQEQLNRYAFTYAIGLLEILHTYTRPDETALEVIQSAIAIERKKLIDNDVKMILK